jgi:non-specific serine/threonine protein kinase
MHQILRFGDCALDTGTGQVTRAGHPLVLEPRTQDVMRYLLRRAGDLVSHDEILGAVWNGTPVSPHALTQAVSQLRRAMKDDRASPRFLETVHRRGYRWICPVQVEDAPRLQDLLDELGQWRAPPPTVHLIGRGGLVDSVVEGLVAARVVVLTGPAGVGKTQVALEAGRRVASRFEHGVLVVGLTAESDATGVARALARALRVDTDGDGTPSGSVVPMLRDRAVLLVLDGCERVADGVSTVATQLVARCAGIRILATTQAGLAIPGQMRIPVPPLRSTRPGEEMGFDPDALSPAVRLFVERARGVNPGFTIDSRNADAITEVCRRLDGIPLAIELAAARANVLAPPEIARRLDARWSLLTTRHPDSASRHDSLREAIAWSTSLLSERSLLLLERLSAFRGGWTLEAAEAVADLPDGPAVDELAGLVDKSLVTVDAGGQQARFDLLDSMHAFLRDRLEATADLAAVRDRHLRHYCEFAREVELRIARGPGPWLRRVREERGNVREALAWALTRPGSSEAGLRLCCDLRWAWRLEGDYREPSEWLTQLLARGTDAAPAIAGRAWIVLGLTQQHRGELDEARLSTRRGLELLPPGERWERAFGLLLLSLVETMAGHLDAADRVASVGARAADALADDRLRAFALVRAALVAGMREDHEGSVRRLLRACYLLLGGGDPFLAAFAKVQLGLQQYLSGARSGARDAALDALRAGLELDNLRAIAGGLEVLAYLAVAEGSGRAAAHLLGASARLREITAAPMLRNFDASHRRAREKLDLLLGADRASRTIDEGGKIPLAQVLRPLLA